MKKAWFGGAPRGDAGAVDSEDSSDNEDGGNMGEVGVNPGTPETGSPGPFSAGEDIPHHEPKEEDPDGGTTEERNPNPDPDGRTEPSPIWSSRHHVFTNVRPVQAPVIQVVYAAYDSMLVRGTQSISHSFSWISGPP